MWWFNRKLLLFGAIALTFGVKGQNCSLSLSGKVNGTDLDFSVQKIEVLLMEKNQLIKTNDQGEFHFSSLCSGDYHLVLSTPNGLLINRGLTLTSDTVLTIDFSKGQLLDQVTLSGQTQNQTTPSVETINKKELEDNPEASLADQIDGLAGVSSIKNGSGISTPVINGLNGNRIMILNNGVAQSAQQWGPDHAPEIDPSIAQNITVIKGVGTVEYLGSGLGSVISVEPSSIEKDPHLHGSVTYYHKTNGRENGAQFNLQKHNSILPFKIIGSLAQGGDLKTPQYYLTNTGNKKLNGAIQLEKEFSDRFNSSFYMSTYNAEIGLLAGSQVGNLTDLEEALQRNTPFFTNDYFSYQINAPKQVVSHFLLKWKNAFYLDENQVIEAVYARQQNTRKEYDVRRKGRSEIPSNSLVKISDNAEIKYRFVGSKTHKFSSGIQYRRTDNQNVPETGILPLIPDYISNQWGLFSKYIWNTQKSQVEWGARLDLENRKVAAISFGVPRQVVRYNNQYFNGVVGLGGYYAFSEKLKLNANTGYSTRNPEVNELYSNGLHQGVSGIEEGDPSLRPESSFKTSIGLEGQLFKKLKYGLLGYYQYIDDFIYLNPQNEIRLTIRGAFPVFKYEQTVASISGIDLNLQYDFSSKFNMKSVFSVIRGDNLTDDIPLVNIPSNSVYAELNYCFGDFNGFSNSTLQLNVKHVFEQLHYLKGQDFVAPPPGYTLLGAKFSTDLKIKKVKLRLFIKGENLLNMEYRDILNRQRYFANDLGINFTTGITMSL